MSDERVIRYADLRAIERNLEVVFKEIGAVQGEVSAVGANVSVVYDELGQLAKEFHDYVLQAEMQHNLEVAETRLGNIRQELEQKYGHYGEVRRATVGILQATDLGVVKKTTISNTTEEMMLVTPNYWLAPCLVALSAWISDMPDIANSALAEALRRNDEKTSLFFALICRRAGRKQACLKWTQRYLANQDERDLDRKSIIIIDAYASGLLGADSEGVVGKQIEKWMDELSSEPGFIEKQRTQWADAIEAKRKPFPNTTYVYLPKYSPTWKTLYYIMEGANLHAETLDYFEKIFDQEFSTASINAQLDEILTSLVTDFDDEELPLREEERLNQFIIQYDGDKKRANQSMQVEKSAFDNHKDFTQLLTDAAMKPESSNASASTQKFAIAMSKDWIIQSYNDVTVKNRQMNPNDIDIEIDTFKCKTQDGNNESELLAKLNQHIDQEKESALATCVMTGFEQFCLWGGIGIAVIGLFMMIAGSHFLGAIAMITGVGFVIKHFSRKKQIENARNMYEDQFERKRESSSQILLGTLAEVVDFRREFAEKDAESSKVIDFLDGISAEQYVRKLATTSRRIQTTA
jgi:hypothetical protein